MQKVKNFDGQLHVVVTQLNKAGLPVQKEFHFSGIDVLEPSKIAASITGGIFTINALFKNRKAGGKGKPLFSSVYPVAFKVTDGSKHKIYDSVQLETSVSMGLKPKNAADFEQNLLSALISMNHVYEYKDMELSDTMKVLNKQLWVSDKIAERETLKANRKAEKLRKKELKNSVKQTESTDTQKVISE